MTLVAVGWPTTFCDKTLVRSSMGSEDCFFDLPCEPFGLSDAPSALTMGGAGFFTRLRRLSSGRFGSFIKWPLAAAANNADYSNLATTVGKRKDGCCHSTHSVLTMAGRARGVNFYTERVNYQNWGWPDYRWRKVILPLVRS